MECKMGGEPGTVNMERNGNERDRERTGTGRIRKKRRHKLNANKRYGQQYGTGQMETDGNKTEHIETSHQLDGTRKARKLERKTGREGDANGTRARRDRKGTETVRGRERTGTGWEREVNGT